jgi:hypothetical protein
MHACVCMQDLAYRQRLRARQEKFQEERKALYNGYLKRINQSQQCTLDPNGDFVRK